MLPGEGGRVRTACGRATMARSEIVHPLHVDTVAISREINFVRNPSIQTHSYCWRGSVPICRGGEQAEVGARTGILHGSKCENRDDHPAASMLLDPNDARSLNIEGFAPRHSLSYLRILADPHHDHSYRGCSATSFFHGGSASFGECPQVKTLRR